MKLALFADIHSNLEAITACLTHAKALGATRYAFLGDLVGYGADPVAVLDLIEQHATEGAVVVLGNHDAAAIGRVIDPLNANAEAAIAWTQTQLRDKQRTFLDSLPLTVREANILFVHASAAAPERSIYIKQFTFTHAGLLEVRQGDGNSFWGELTDEIAPARDADGKVDIQGTMQIITSIVEGWVREHPEQWLWLHRRWR